MPYPMAAARGGMLRYPASAAFIGPYDAIPNIAAAYGMRRLRSAYTGSLLRLRRSSDNTEQDFGYTSSGDLDTAAIATFVGGGSGFVTTWYDQSGNGKDATQSTAANQPQYIANVKNGHPIARGDGTNDGLIITRNGTTAASVLAVGIKRSSSGSSSKCLWAFRDAASMISNSGVSASGYGWFSPVEDLGGTITNWNVLTTVFASVSSVTNYVNGAGAVTFDPNDAYSTQTSMGLFCRPEDSANNGDFDLAEFVVASAAWGTTDRQAAETAANQYWSVF